MKSVFSFLSNDQSFPVYKKREGAKVSAAKIETAILVKGGANVANKHQLTNKFVETKLSDEDFKSLQENKVFQRFVKRGFITTTKPKADAVKRDKSAPKTEKELKDKVPNAKVKVETNEEKPE